MLPPILRNVSVSSLPLNQIWAIWVVGVFCLEAFVSGPHPASGLRAQDRPLSQQRNSQKPDNQKPTNQPPEGPKLPVEQLAKRVRKSVVIVSYLGRSGRTEGIGTGFVIDESGLIATNLHVIGQARPIQVETVDGQRFPVRAVEASDRPRDLAILRIDTGGKRIPQLKLADSSQLKEGQPVVAIGNPYGLRYSVVAGIVSALREIDGRPMIQVALPVEKGNSGGPLVNAAGEVVGVVTLKAAVTRNLGFAVGSNALQELLDRPNPITMERWLTIGALDPKEWKALFGARWWQRAGRIKVSELGNGFGGRSLCLWQGPAPEGHFELAVTVRLNEESGAAGLIWHSDGKNRHYGFYPSNGSLRLSRFDGPDVFSWRVLQEVRSSHYRPGKWNRLTVRVEKTGTLRCFVNNHLVIESTDQRYRQGHVGLAKFRDTIAEFKRFAVGRELPSEQVPEKLTRQVAELARRLHEEDIARPTVLDQLGQEGPTGVLALQRQAEVLQQQAAKLRELAQAVHRRRVIKQLSAMLDQPEQQVDLFEATLLLAWLDNNELDRQAYRKDFRKLAAGLRVPNNANDRQKLNRLKQYLFEEQGFHGSRGDYYNQANSYINEVLDDREGLPITLSVLSIELGRQIGLQLEGIGLPGHFVVGYRPPGARHPQLIDVFQGGQTLTLDEAKELVVRATENPWQDEYLQPTSKRAIITRMLYNL